MSGIPESLLALLGEDEPEFTCAEAASVRVAVDAVTVPDEHPEPYLLGTELRAVRLAACVLFDVQPRDEWPVTVDKLLQYAYEQRQGPGHDAEAWGLVYDAASEAVDWCES